MMGQIGIILMKITLMVSMIKIRHRHLSQKKRKKNVSREYVLITYFKVYTLSKSDVVQVQNRVLMAPQKYKCLLVPFQRKKYPLDRYLTFYRRNNNIMINCSFLNFASSCSTLRNVSCYSSDDYSDEDDYYTDDDYDDDDSQGVEDNEENWTPPKGWF